MTDSTTPSWRHPAMMMRPRRLNADSAWKGHIPFAAWLVAVMQPRRIVELGSHWGDSYFAFCQAAASFAPEAQLFAVDTWQGDEQAGHYDSDVYRSVERYNRRYASRSTLLRMTFDEALSQIDDGSVDILHIDGLHTYDAVRHDFETWLPKVSTNGVILFHDTQERERDFGVWRLWEELHGKYRSIEFAHWHGLGAIFLGEPPYPARAMLNDRENVIEVFSAQARKLGFFMWPDEIIAQVHASGGLTPYHKARVFLRAIPQAVKADGGAWAASRTAWSVYQQEGLSGLKLHIYLLSTSRAAPQGLSPGTLPLAPAPMQRDKSGTTD